jgi:hypothetical protein
MPLWWIVEPIDILEYRAFAWRRVSHRLRQISSALMDLKNLATMRCLTSDLHGKSAKKGVVIAIAFAAHPVPGSGCSHPREGRP